MMFKKDMIYSECMGNTSPVTPEQIRDFHMPVINAFIEDDEMYSITIRRLGTSFVPVTYTKVPADKGLADIIKISNSVLNR